jgi:vWA-MoxR associated protein C-terminal domain/Effector-associated domain 2
VSSSEPMSAGWDQDGVLLGLVKPHSDTVDRLANAMVKLDVMNEPRDRRQVIRWVMDRNPAFRPSNDPTDWKEIVNLIEACGADDESFDLLLEAIELYTDAGDQRLSDLQGQVASLLRRAALTKSELSELLALEPDTVVRAEQLARGIRRVWPGVVGLEERRPGDVREAALFLLDYPDTAQGLRRLLGFVNWLAEAAGVYEAEGSPLVGQLLDWAARIGDTHNLTAAPWRTLTRAVSHQEPALLIELEPTMADRFTVHLWLWIPGLGTRTLEWADEPCRLDELRGRVDDLLELASRELIEVEGALRVEFVLNLENVHHDVDWWLSGVEQGQADDGQGVPLGAEYAVIVRPKRRTFKEMRLWRERWQALQGATKPVTDLAVWITDTATRVEDLWSRFIDKPERIFIAPLGAGEKPDDAMKRLLGLATIRYGVPVALCLRQTPVGPSPGLDRLGTALTDARVADLPGLVRAWRMQAYLEKGDHFGRYLVLLWDEFDKDRNWPPSNTDGQLAMPAVRGASR